MELKLQITRSETSTDMSDDLNITPERRKEISHLVNSIYEKDSPAAEPVPGEPNQIEIDMTKAFEYLNEQAANLNEFALMMYFLGQQQMQSIFIQNPIRAMKMTMM